jgi:hypothetical protein
VKQITTMGLDLAKQIFQIHGADAEGNVIINRKLRRAEVLRLRSQAYVDAAFTIVSPTEITTTVSVLQRRKYCGKKEIPSLPSERTAPWQGLRATQVSVSSGTNADAPVRKMAWCGI